MYMMMYWLVIGQRCSSVRYTSIRELSQCHKPKENVSIHFYIYVAVTMYGAGEIQFGRMRHTCVRRGSQGVKHENPLPSSSGSAGHKRVVLSKHISLEYEWLEKVSLSDRSENAVSISWVAHHASQK